MKHHRYSFYIISIFIAALLSGLVSGCASTTEKKLKTKGFSLSFRDKVVAGFSGKEIQLNHPIKLSEEEVRNHLKSLVFEELSLFGSKTSVFLPREIDRIGRLLAKAIQRVPSHKIIHYELETPKGATSGDVFASKNHIHWRFDSIKGLGFSGRSYTGGGNTNWRMVPQSGQKYKTVKKLLGTQAQENWVFARLQPSSKWKEKVRQQNHGSNPSRRKAEAPLRPSENSRKTSPAKNIDPVLEEKLELLRDLLEKNLIDKNEYDQKKKDLLDTYL
jgi:hypothetical protein